MDVDELTSWLAARDLADCAQFLIDNAVDLEVLPDLSDQDLASIGLVLGLRRKLMKAAASLRPTVPSNDPPQGAATSVGERRYVTIMFSDLVGSTRISAAMDAEEWRDLVAAYHVAVAAAVEPLGGNVAQKMGDGAMIYFGYPLAHEDDAERAVRAGLGILQGLSDLNRRLVAVGKPSLAARVGLHSGPVVVDGGEFAFGDVPNVAARVQAAAEPGQILISAAVHRHVSGLFIVEDCGVHMLKGVPEPVSLLRVVRASGASRRRSGSALTPFVGRDHELELLCERWERARTRESVVIAVIGEAGFGKSRLIEEFRATLVGSRHTWAEWSCTQLFRHTPFYPIVEWARQRFGGSEIAPEHRLTELETTLVSLGLVLSDTVPALAPLFGLPLLERYPPSKLSPEETRRA
ncbi:MAG: adenylate/guanylate cyclase domain-containing protein [Gammaproteobacteria bacterium]|nr:adenylate/guanylate cyclase domain-containing protein [Gammaproteobacteria bacterium]